MIKVNTSRWRAGKVAVKQMISNLASNAVTHSSDKEAQIVVREADADAVLMVSNRGNPIPEDEQQQILEPFVHKGGSAAAQRLEQTRPRPFSSAGNRGGALGFHHD